MKDEDRVAVLVEYLDDKFDLMEQNFVGIRSDIKNLDKRLQQVEENTKDTSVMREVVKDHSRQLNQHEKELTFLKKQIA